MPARQFTLEEAQEMLAHIAPLLWDVREKKKKHDELAAELNEVQVAVRSNGHSMESAVAEKQRQIGETATVMNEIIERIHEMGVELKDVEMGLIDFRHVREDGREVYLCWKLGEPDIQWWHPLDTGFASRQPLSGALDD
jgi:hypothetical protein